MKKEASPLVFLASAAALMGAVSIGVTIGYTSPALPSLANDTTKMNIPTTDTDLRGWISASMPIGALFGGLSAGAMASKFGRKNSLILYGVPFTLGWSCILFAQSSWFIILGRIITGLSSGLVCGTAPTYVVEITTPANRGLLGTCFQVCLTIGILLCPVCGLFLNWRLLALVGLIPGVLMSLLMLAMPESPTWLLATEGRESPNAEAAMKKFRTSKSDIKEELDELYEGAKESGKSGLMLTTEQMKRKDIWKPGLLAIGLMFYQQFSGINIVMFYMETILDETKTINPKVGGIVINIFQVIATISGTFLIDKLGRKKLLLISGMGHIFSLLVLGFYFLKVQELKGEQFFAGWKFVPLISLCIFIISFSVGYGPIPWMMVPEMTPPIARSLISAVSTCFNWTCAFLTTKFFEPVKVMLTEEKIYIFYWVFAFICLTSCVFVSLFLPETKNKTIEEIQNEFRGQVIEPNKIPLETVQLPDTKAAIPSDQVSSNKS